MPAWCKVAAVDYKYTDDQGWEPSPFKKERAGFRMKKD